MSGFNYNFPKSIFQTQIPFSIFQVILYPCIFISVKFMFHYASIHTNLLFIYHNYHWYIKCEHFCLFILVFTRFYFWLSKFKYFYFSNPTQSPNRDNYSHFLLVIVRIRSCYMILFAMFGLFPALIWIFVSSFKYNNYCSIMIFVTIESIHTSAS